MGFKHEILIGTQSETDFLHVFTHKPKIDRIHWKNISGTIIADFLSKIPSIRRINTKNDGIPMFGRRMRVFAEFGRSRKTHRIWFVAFRSADRQRLTEKQWFFHVQSKFFPEPLFIIHVRRKVFRYEILIGNSLVFF